MARLGKNQIAFLAGIAGTGRAVVVGDKLIRSLAKAGCLKALGANSFYVITPAGLRSVADAIDGGALKPTTLDDFKKAVS